MEPITGATLKTWGYPPGKWYPEAIKAAEEARLGGASEARIRAVVDGMAPPPTIPMRTTGPSASFNIDPGADDGERANVEAVRRHMDDLMRVPTIVSGAVMPDACPSGSAPGTIPVGGVVATKNAIHPGFHSADICCSMACTIFEDADPAALLDAGMRLSHFGGGGRPRGTQISPERDILDAFAANSFLSDKVSIAIEHHASQGDGNHFFYVGRLASEGKIALVTHHGSRKPGAMLYRDGMTMAKRVRTKLSPETPDHNAWIPSETAEGDAYWSALQIIRQWTKSSHFAIHDLVAEALGLRRWHRFWNEHNFVFRKSDGLFYHAKGATPAFPGYAADASGQTLIPLNMGAPILIAEGRDEPRGLGFAPHGAGRNFSRTAYMRTLSADGSKRVADDRISEIVREQTPGIDVRFFCGHPDISELPGAYKSASTIRSQIESYGLATAVDTIEPIGSIMAGDWERDAPWRKKRERKAAAAPTAE